MRLLTHKLGGDSDDFSLITFRADNVPPYAILSHTWSDEEVTYDDLLSGLGKNKRGYKKIRFCAERASQDELAYFWVDTCCINKSDQQELQTAINSMFQWYQRAPRCYVYLSDVRVPGEVTDPQSFRIAWEYAFRRSRWFRRGWTLQELLAPSTVEFFSKEGRRLGSKVTLEQEISSITDIPVEALRGQKPLSQFSVSERISWAASRQTTLVEDGVYCLFGIFSVFLPLLYGEGRAHASRRLIKEIREYSNGPLAFSIAWTCCRCEAASLYEPFPACPACGHSRDNCCKMMALERRKPGRDPLIKISFSEESTGETEGSGDWVAEFSALNRRRRKRSAFDKK